MWSKHGHKVTEIISSRELQATIPNAKFYSIHSVANNVSIQIYYPSNLDLKWRSSAPLVSDRCAVQPAGPSAFCGCRTAQQDKEVNIWLTLRTNINHQDRQSDRGNLGTKHTFRVVIAQFVNSAVRRWGSTPTRETRDRIHRLRLNFNFYIARIQKLTQTDGSVLVVEFQAPDRRPGGVVSTSQKLNRVSGVGPSRHGVMAASWIVISDRGPASLRRCCNLSQDFLSQLEQDSSRVRGRGYLPGWRHSIRLEIFTNICHLTKTFSCCIT